MKALLIILLILLVLVLLGLVRVGVHVEYEKTVRVRLRIGRLKISFPKEKKSKKHAVPKDEEPEKPERAQASRLDAKGWLRAALAHWQDILALLGRALHMPKLDPLILYVTTGGSDPAEQALNYGRVWAILGAVLPVLENTFRIGQRDVDVRCDGNRDGFIFYLETGLTVRIYEIFLLGVLGLKLLIQIYRTKSNQKAVQTT